VAGLSPSLNSASLCPFPKQPALAVISMQIIAASRPIAISTGMPNTRISAGTAMHTVSLTSRFALKKYRRRKIFLQCPKRQKYQSVGAVPADPSKPAPALSISPSTNLPALYRLHPRPCTSHRGEQNGNSSPSSQQRPTTTDPVQELVRTSRRVNRQLCALHRPAHRIGKQRSPSTPLAMPHRPVPPCCHRGP